jgi:hypothetical protein
MNTPKVLNVNDMLKPTNQGNGFMKSLNPTILLRIAALIIIVGSIIGIITYHPALDTGDSSVIQTSEENNDRMPILNPQFGKDYIGGGGLDTLYDDLGGNDPLNNAKLEAKIRVDTDQYSCKFNVNYDGPDNKKVECSGGCFDDDENSKFCESYIYNDQENGGKSLETLYDDAGGNNGGRVPAQYTANINVSSGYDFNKDEDTSCGFYVEYEGNNKRTVKCNNTDCPDKCKAYDYTNRHIHGEKGDTLLDNTYINRRDNSVDQPCQYCNDKQQCVNDECVCIDGYEGEYCQKKKSPGEPGSQSGDPSSTSNSKLVGFSVGYVIIMLMIVIIALTSINTNDKYVMFSIFIFGIYTIIMGYAFKEWKWLILLWILEVIIGIITMINIFGDDDQSWAKIFQFIFILFYIGNFFIMNSLV